VGDVVKLPQHRPEILAPAGDEASLRAALAAGADAVYFGLDDGYNARARADNFSLATLPATLALIHRAGARAYLTVNTLVFEPELEVIERLLAEVARAGVDALIIQDPAVALIAGALCPTLELHGSTQMTVSSGEGARFAAGLGITRLVVPRELSVDEIRRLAQATPLELEVFIHGALCVSWSGQCLTSEAWGGRSANRGQCAQSCRMPYALVVDGKTLPVGEGGDVQYLLSPKDLAGAGAVPELCAIGVRGLKIEGRQKGPEYVATAVAGYRRWLDGLAAERPDEQALAHDLADMALSYSRGFSPGFLGGVDHQHLVEGRFPKARGVYLGRVVARSAKGVVVEVEARVKTPKVAVASVVPRPGMGVVFDAGRPEDKHEPGGPIFRVEPAGAGRIRLGFGQPGPDLGRVAPGDRVWLNSDPAIAQRTARLVERAPEGRLALELTVRGAAGAPLAVSASVPAQKLDARATSEVALSPAQTGLGLDDALVSDKLGALGGTPFRLARLDTAGLAPGLHLPVSELKRLRRALVAELDAKLAAPPTRAVAEASVVAGLRARALAAAGPPRAPLLDRPTLVPLVRTEAQLEAVIATGLAAVELDWMELVGLGRAVARARAAGLHVTVATVRVHKPGEEGYDRRVAALAPDAVLVRNWGALMHFRGADAGAPRPALHGDFSLNVTNSLSFAHVLGLGLDTITAAHDLDAAQLFTLLEQVPAERLTVAVHHHIATFHTEHCVYAHTLSSGRDFHTCGRPCEAHALALRDYLGLEHPVIVDVGCRNTVYNAQAQSAAQLVPRLVERGVRRFRVELVRETFAEAQVVLAAYQSLVDGAISPAEAVRRAGGHEQFGVTRGTMRVLR
jgi:putative protease